METIGKRLEYYLKEKRITVAEMSEKTGIPKPSIYRIFNSESGLNSTTLASLIESYPDLNITWLITGKGNYKKNDVYHTVNEKSIAYDNNTDAELKMKVRTILNNEVVLDAFIEILKKYDR